tara:strand:+ start:481 stop:1545 length:1065 start_codon:yes stop_codon:yes gene_type:complete
MIGFVLTGYLIQLKEEKKRAYKKKISLSELTVIIPFRNEEKRIVNLLKSIAKSVEKPNDILFVNDHSEDDGVKTIKNLLKKIPHKIIQLNEGESGKKTAIKKGIENTKSKYILTIDADVSFDRMYFKNIETICGNDLCILPVDIQSNGIYKIFTLDVLLANSLNISANSFFRPIIASGANLLFNRYSYLKYEDISHHLHIKSGDDIYLLKRLNDQKIDIDIYTNSNLKVYTKEESGIPKIINQRSRWLSKMRYVKDYYLNSLAIFQGVISMIFIVFLIIGWNYFSIENYLYIILFKGLIDQVSLFPYFYRLRKMKEWFILPFFTTIHPIYSLVILIAAANKKRLWKKRPLIDRS